MRNTVLVFVSLLAIALLVGGCTKQREVGKHETAQATVKGAILETVKKTALPDVAEVPGTVRAGISAVVSTRIPGSIAIMKVKEGDRVTRGQLLIQLNAQENQANAAVAVAAIDEARRGLDESLTRKKLADLTFARFQNLYDEQAVSRQEFDARQTEKEAAAQGAARAESRLRQAQEAAKASATMSDYTKITAPITGVIVSKQADLGATVFPGQQLLTIEDEGNHLLELAMPENIATKVKVGASVQVTLDALGAPFAGRIAQIVPAADFVSRTFAAKINLTQKGLKSGMFGRASIMLGTETSGISIPKNALVERGALTSVWTVDATNSARMRIVKIGRQAGQRVEVLSGLSEGDRIIAGGLEKVTEAARVE